ncbi:unnamed protein product [Linum trigynum]|uniref:Uncharacterized protein n=1 Tax=Linum trigynum TaxID=586398 RepID=A0AAV2DY76_9ROSI
MATRAKDQHKKELKAAEAKVERLEKDLSEYHKSDVGKNLQADTVIDTVKILREKVIKDHPEVEWDSIAMIMHVLKFMDSGRKASELEPFAGLEVASPNAGEEKADEEEEAYEEGDEEEDEGTTDGEDAGEGRLPEPQGTPEGAV